MPNSTYHALPPVPAHAYRHPIRLTVEKRGPTPRSTEIAAGMYNYDVPAGPLRSAEALRDDDRTDPDLRRFMARVVESLDMWFDQRTCGLCGERLYGMTDCMGCEDRSHRAQRRLLRRRAATRS